MTGSEDVQVAVAALKAGAVDYVWKDVQGHFRDLLCSAALDALEKERLRRDKVAADAEILAARERAEILLQEVNHRVANSLQLVTSMIGMQIRSMEGRSVDPREALLETQNRITAIAQVHRRLYTSPNVKAVDLRGYLTGLVAELGAAMRESGHAHSIKLVADSLDAAPDKAVAAGIIVNELVTNACKYAYPDGPDGEIRVMLTVGEEGARLSVEDDGVGRQAGVLKGYGLGDKIVQAMCASLGAKLDTQSSAKGTRATIVFGR